MFSKQSSSKVSTSIPPTQDPLPSASFHSRPAQLNKPGAKRAAAPPQQSYVRQEQQQAATDKAADQVAFSERRTRRSSFLARSHGSCPSRKTNPGSRGFTEKVREETAQAKRFRSNSYGLPASSLLLLAWRLKKNGAAPQQGRFNRASASEPCFRPEVENRSRGTKIDARQPETTAGPRKTRRAPGGNRARDHPLQRRTQDHWATSPAAGPRRARGPRAGKRPQPRKRASLARADFGPELGFEQRSRFRSSQDICRT